MRNCSSMGIKSFNYSRWVSSRDCNTTVYLELTTVYCALKIFVKRANLLLYCNLREWGCINILNSKLNSAFWIKMGFTLLKSWRLFTEQGKRNQKEMFRYPGTHTVGGHCCSEETYWSGRRIKDKKPCLARS